MKRSRRAGTKSYTRTGFGRPRYPVVESLQRFLKAYGHGSEGNTSRAHFAERVGTSVDYLLQLGLGFRQASMELAVRIERASHGLIRAEELAPGGDWAYLAARIPDPLKRRRKSTRATERATA
jgi:hypothetical protein